MIICQYFIHMVYYIITYYMECTLFWYTMYNIYRVYLNTTLVLFCTRSCIFKQRLDLFCRLSPVISLYQLLVHPPGITAVVIHDKRFVAHSNIQLSTIMYWWWFCTSKYCDMMIEPVDCEGSVLWYMYDDWACRLWRVSPTVHVWWLSL